MQIIADLHVHSKYSRATSKNLNISGLWEAASMKGIHLMGTGDFTHPLYLEELKHELVEDPERHGFFCLKSKKDTAPFPVFVLTVEISCIYSEKSRVRRNHILIAVPDLETLDRLQSKLSLIGNLAADGRPILGISAKELVRIALEVDPTNLVIPAHIWTPWFSTFGSKSGFDSISECFQEMAPHILAVETGLSSDPLMNWQVRELDAYALVSHGDAHSAMKVGREATVYELEKVAYTNVSEALKNSSKLDKERMPKNYVAYTIEFYPEEGKYHFDGHRDCGMCLSPAKTHETGGICPVCRKPVTIGVMHRVTELRTRSESEALAYGKEFRPPFKKIVPLIEIIADALGQRVGGKKVQEEYDALIREGGSELDILLHTGDSELLKFTRPEIVEGIVRVRDGKVLITPGYDGEYGAVGVFTDEERRRMRSPQSSLF